MNIWRRLSKIEKTTTCIVLLFTVFQIFSVFIWSAPQTSDGAGYVGLAQGISQRGSFYPDKDNLYDNYVFNPGYVNYLSLFFRITNDLRVPMLFNVALTLILGFCVYYIGVKLFKSSAIGCTAVILMYLLITNSSEVLLIRSELLFSVLAYAGVAVMLSCKRAKYLICGLLLTLANWVRPLGIAFLVGILIYLIIKKVKLRYLAQITAMFLSITVIIGIAGYLSCGRFVYSTTTGGYNLIMSANDDADGTYNPSVFTQGNPGHLTPEQKTEMTFDERDDYWMSQSVEWIKENPAGYLKQIPMKLFGLFAYDTYSITGYSRFETQTMSKAYLVSVLKKVVNLNFNELTGIDCAVIYNQIVYMIILVFALAGLILLLRKKENIANSLLFVAIVGIGTAITVVVVAGARYHHPFLPVFYLLAAFFANKFFAWHKNKKEKKLKLK